MAPVAAMRSGSGWQKVREAEVAFAKRGNTWSRRLPVSVRDVMAVSSTAGWVSRMRRSSMPVYPLAPTMAVLMSSMVELFPCFSVLANGRLGCFFRCPSMNGLWRSLVARYTGGVEAVGSNPASPTIGEGSCAGS